MSGGDEGGADDDFLSSLENRLAKLKEPVKGDALEVRVARLKGEVVEGDLWARLGRLKGEKSVADPKEVERMEGVQEWDDTHVQGETEYDQVENLLGMVKEAVSLENKHKKVEATGKYLTEEEQIAALLEDVQEDADVSSAYSSEASDTPQDPPTESEVQHIAKVFDSDNPLTESEVEGMAKMFGAGRKHGDNKTEEEEVKSVAKMFGLLKKKQTTPDPGEAEVDAVLREVLAADYSEDDDEE